MKIQDRKAVWNELLLKKQADSSLLDGAKSQLEGVIPKVAKYLKEQWDPKHPYSSVAAFALPVLLNEITFGTFGWILTFAEALGWVDIKKTFISIGEALEPLFKQAMDGKDVDTSQVATAVQQHLGSSSNPDDSLLEKVIKMLPSGISSFFGKSSSNIEANRIIRRAILQSKNGYKISEAGITSSILKGYFIGPFISLITWIFGKLLKSLAMIAVPAAVVSGFGGTPGSGNSSSSSSSQSGGGSVPENDPTQEINLKLNPSLSSDYTHYHRNDSSGVWMEGFPIEDIKNELMKWVVDCYPELSDKKSQISNLSSFNEIVSLIVQRNNAPSVLPFTVIPKPYTRKLDIVNTIVKDYEKTQSK